MLSHTVKNPPLLLPTLHCYQTVMQTEAYGYTTNLVMLISSLIQTHCSHHFLYMLHCTLYERNTWELWDSPVVHVPEKVDSEFVCELIDYVCASSCK